MSLILVIDAGTTGVKSCAVDHDGTIAAEAYREFPQLYPKPGLIEHNPEDIWRAVVATMADVNAAITEPIEAIGITNQRETILLWDGESGVPLDNAIVWQDRRTADRCSELIASGHNDYVRSTTGLLLDPYFSATKIEWLLQKHAKAITEATRCGTIDTWILWKLTGGKTFATDVSNASRTLLFDIHRLEWSDELLGLFSVPKDLLPEVKPSNARFGETTAGLPIAEAIPICGIAGDQQAALFGQACFRRGESKNTYGTGSFVLANAGETPPVLSEGLLTTVAWQLVEQDKVKTFYALEGSIFSTGATIQWLRDGLSIISEAAEVEPLAQSVDDNGGVYLVPAFAGLGSPWWDPQARGTITGLTRGTTKAHIARAAIESIAFQTRDVVDKIRLAGVEIDSLKVDGGASVMDSLLQQQATQLGVSVRRSATTQATALGAAFLAGLSVGFWESQEEIEKCWKQDVAFKPDGAALNQQNESYLHWLRAVERSKDWDVPV